MWTIGLPGKESRSSGDAPPGLARSLAEPGSRRARERSAAKGGVWLSPIPRQSATRSGQFGSRPELARASVSARGCTSTPSAAVSSRLPQRRQCRSDLAPQRCAWDRQNHRLRNPVQTWAQARREKNVPMAGVARPRDASAFRSLRQQRSWACQRPDVRIAARPESGLKRWVLRR